ncbi:MAG: 4-hydroxy-3-methylbut-2-enyl diphosphate reductase [Dehalococcoidales bacterium]|nr:4-hydroxy-3-methylbut-2-enyl diphosphate reductase [Dehalococcoidales bacterium]
MKIEKAAGTGFCFGVRRAINILEKTAAEQGKIETLKAVVHNKQVLKRLAKQGITVANTIEDVKGDTVAIGAHGVGPETAKKIEKRKLKIVDTTCRFVNRAQSVAQRLSKAGFFVVVYGDVNHPEVKGILAWANNKGIATLDTKTIAELDPLPKRIGVLAQTTQIPANFNEFIKQLVDITLNKDSELHIVDTICHDIRRRQESAQKLAKKVDLMFVVGDHTSANTHRLAELCSHLSKTYLIETAAEIKPVWLKGHEKIGITGGASTAEETIDEVLAKLEKLTGKSS